MKVLVTGGMGYIGSHTVCELLNDGMEVVIVDDLSNSSINVKEKIETITNKTVDFYEVDVCNYDDLEVVFKKHKFDGVIHFAGYKAVGESVQQPLKYYKNNIDSTITLCLLMEKYDCFNLVFSSSATVYGDPEFLPIKETAKLSTTNPYGTTKLYIEQILRDLSVSNSKWNITLLRYFNPIGAHESGLIGESPNGIPNNLMPYIVKVAKGQLECLSVFGNDYDTIDGTGVRDYIHVCDLANGHLKALRTINGNDGVKVYNLGTGTGYSVLQIIETFKKVNNVNVNYKITKRRPGDIASCYADASLAKEEIGFETIHDIDSMCKSSWNYINK